MLRAERTATMDAEPAAEFTFVCPACGETLAVNGSMRDALVTNGCVLCTTPVTPDAFTWRADRGPATLGRLLARVFGG